MVSLCVISGMWTFLSNPKHKSGTESVTAREQVLDMFFNCLTHSLMAQKVAGGINERLCYSGLKSNSLSLFQQIFIEHLICARHCANKA